MNDLPNTKQGQVLVRKLELLDLATSAFLKLSNGINRTRQVFAGNCDWKVQKAFE